MRKMAVVLMVFMTLLALPALGMAAGESTVSQEQQKLLQELPQSSVDPFQAVQDSADRSGKSPIKPMYNEPFFATDLGGEERSTQSGKPKDHAPKAAPGVSPVRAEPVGRNLSPTQKYRIVPLEEPEPTFPEGRQTLKAKSTAPVELSFLEKIISADDLLTHNRIADGNPAKDIQQFGYNFFRESSLTPALDVPVSADYLLSPGDTLVITVWGGVNGTYEVPISRSGEVTIPKVGPVKLAGLPFGSVSAVLKARFSQIYRNFDLAVNMGRLSTIKVYVVGEVVSPGDYAVSSLATVINALGAAGGPTKNGSLRNIKVRRAAGGEELLDLYDFLTSGDKSRDLRLQSGDTIFVPVIGRVAAIAGNVKRPAIYEMKKEQTLKDLIALAEGVTATGYLQRVQISRVVANDKKNVIDLNLDPQKTGKNVEEFAAGVAISDMDVVRVFAISGLLRGHVKLKGHVERPGFYAIIPGQKISSLLTRDQLLPEYNAAVLEITRLVEPDFHPEKILVNLTAAMAKDPQHDLQLHEFDTLRIFSRWDLEERQTVRINGEVQQSGDYLYYTGMTVRDLLLQAGNPKASAYLKSAELSRLNRDTEKISLKPITIDLVGVLTGDAAQNIKLQPFDELNVRKIPSWSEEKERYVNLSGEFQFPGTYPVYKGERLSSVIARAGGFTEKAYLLGAKFTREKVRELQQQRLNEALERAEETVVKKQALIMSASVSKEELEAAKAALEGIDRSIKLLKTRKAEGRVVIKLTDLEHFRGGTFDVELFGGDTLHVPANPASVNILGSVYNPTSTLYEPGENIDYYINKVGGVSQDGESDETYIVKADGTVFSRQQASSFLFFNSFGSHIVTSGDTIVVPQKVERVALMRDIKDVTTILAQLAISAGTVILGLK